MGYCQDQFGVDRDYNIHITSKDNYIGVGQHTKVVTRILSPHH